MRAPHLVHSRYGTGLIVNRVEQGYGGSLRHWRALYLLPSNAVLKLLAAWCPSSQLPVFSFSSQLSVASSQFSVSQLRRFRRLFALRNQGRSRRRRYPGMVGFFAKIRCAHSFASAFRF